MPEANFDYETAFLILALALVLVTLLLPVPEPPRDEPPTEDTTHTRRRR